MIEKRARNLLERRLWANRGKLPQPVICQFPVRRDLSGFQFLLLRSLDVSLGVTVSTIVLTRARAYHEMVNFTNLAFLLHILIEVPASINFLFNPSATPSTPQPHAHAVIRQYAVLLMVTNIIALIFYLRPPDLLSCRVAGALSLYHIGPLVRAIIRQFRGERGRGGNKLGGPLVHAIVHVVCFWALAIEFAAYR